MGERDARIRGHTGGRGHAAHHFEGDSSLAKGHRLLAAAAKDIGVATLETDDSLPLASIADELFIQRFLNSAHAAAAAVTDVEALALGWRQIEYAGIDEIVVEHDIGHAQELGTLQREQPGVTRPGADDVDAAGRGGEGHGAVEGERFMKRGC